MGMGLVVLVSEGRPEPKTGHKARSSGGPNFLLSSFREEISGGSSGGSSEGTGLRPLRGRRDGPSLPRLRLGGSSRVRARPEAVPYGMGSATASRMSSGDGDPAGMVLPYQWAPLIDNDLQ